MIPSDYINLICHKYGLTEARLFGSQRSKSLLKPRVELAKILRNFGMSYPEIGKIMNRDHTSIMYYVRKPDMEKIP